MFRVVDAIRKELPVESGFCLGIKLNSSDYVVSLYKLQFVCRR